jgi:hypothetical protein
MIEKEAPLAMWKKIVICERSSEHLLADKTLLVEYWMQRLTAAIKRVKSLLLRGEIY